MKKAKNKTAIAIALLLMFAMAISLVALPTANAQSTKTTYAYIGATPNPVGVSQPTLLHAGITDPIGGVSYGWEDLSVTITRPDGTTETIEDIRTDSTGGTGRVYTPSMAGNYTLQTHFPEQEMPITSSGVPAGTKMLASDSPILTLVVQEEPIEYYPGHPLPNEYWTRPIDAQQREWYTIAGSWLFTPNDRADPYDQSRFAPYNEGPESAHILWTKPFTTGGLAGGELGLVGSGANSVGMETGDAYEGKWPGPLIIAGKLYYTAGGSRSLQPAVTYCVDLHTGEELWSKIFLDNRTISFGQLFYWQSYNDQGTFAYLWVSTGGRGEPTTWTAFDAFTGDWRFTITNVPSGTTLRDEKGGLYILQTDLTNGWMALWNASALGSMDGSWGNTVHMQTLNATATSPASALAAAERAWAWNVTTLPKNIHGSVRATKLNDRIVGASITTTEVNMWAFSLKAGQEGQLLYNNTWKAPADWATGNQSISWQTSCLEEKVGILMSKELVQNYGFSLETGEYLWGPTPSQNYLDMYGDQLNTRIIAYGRFYSVGMAGIVYCYNVTTGNLLWTYEIADPYTENLFANNWWSGILFITDGKLYLGSAEHSPNQPLPRGAPFVCLDATTGDEIWRADGLFRQTLWGGLAIIGDSIIAAQDTYDQRVYAIGKGPSATSVAASPKVSVHGNSVLVEGMVTDVSPGTKDAGLTMRFPNGVPAVCDENMSDWMLYVYKQFARPADVTGVEVVIEVLDPNNNYYEVGRTTSDASGMFHCAFTPEVPGEYTIIATFAGSGAYYGSFAETAINVEEAPVATPEPTPVPQAPVETYFTVSTIAIIVAIAVAVVLLLRKR
jgi:hypothetical protein